MSRPFATRHPYGVVAVAADDGHSPLAGVGGWMAVADCLIGVSGGERDERFHLTRFPVCSTRFLLLQRVLVDGLWMDTRSKHVRGVAPSADSNTRVADSYGTGMSGR